MTDRSAIYRHVSLRSVTCKVEVMPIDLPSIVTHVNTRFGLDARIKNERHVKGPLVCVSSLIVTGFKSTN